jgi:mannose-6-phosphate isomerase
MDLLRPVVRPYAWGSRTAIAELQGRPVPAAGPEAELWMGAHPSAPSGVARDPATLDAVIAAAPDRELGPQCAATFGGRLPFLLKVLSADKALSIQVHPTRAQAEAGYQAENRRGLAPGDPARNYVDDWPKPELLYALTPFEVVAGLRTPADAADLLLALAVDQLRPLAGELSAATSEQAMADALASVLQWPEGSRAGLVADVVVACSKLAASGSEASGSEASGSEASGSEASGSEASGSEASGSEASGSEVSRYADACAAAVRVAVDHPDDLGIVALLLMRHAVLQPGQAVFMPAGGLHAYLRGTGIELLANSDNVVRAGLTGKHIDVPELLKLLDPVVSVPVIAPRVLPDGIAWFDTPAPEFRLYLLDLAGPALALPGRGPRILLCLEGACVLRSASGEALELARGGSCFIPAVDPLVHAAGSARLVLAAPGAP